MASSSRRQATGEGGFEVPTTISRTDFLQGGSDEVFRETIYTMVRGLGGLLRCREMFARHLGLTGSQFAVLMGTAYRQGATGVTIRDLAEHVRLASTHVTTEVGRLIRRKLLVKRPSASDGRSVLVSLSQEGEDAVRRIAPLVREVNDALFERIEAAELARVDQALRRLAENADRALADLRQGVDVVSPGASEAPGPGGAGKRSRRRSPLRA